MFAWAQLRLARKYNLDSLDNSYWWKSSTGYGSRCSTSIITRRILEMNAWIMQHAFNLVSYYNDSTRWARHFFDSTPCFATCHNLGDVLENYVTFEWSMFLLPSTKQERALCSSQVFIVSHRACITSLVIVGHFPHAASCSWLKVALCHGKVRFACFKYFEFCRYHRA